MPHGTLPDFIFSFLQITRTTSIYIANGYMSLYLCSIPLKKISEHIQNSYHTHGGFIPHYRI